MYEQVAGLIIDEAVTDGDFCAGPVLDSEGEGQTHHQVGQIVPEDLPISSMPTALSPQIDLERDDRLTDYIVPFVADKPSKGEQSTQLPASNIIGGANNEEYI